MASKRRLRRKACDGKTRFETQDAARKAASCVKHKKGLDDWLTAYRCQFCKGFHFGHPPKEVRQAIADKRYDKFSK